MSRRRTTSTPSGRWRRGPGCTSRRWSNSAMVTVPALSAAESRPTHLTTFTVKVGGAELPATVGVVGVDIERAVGRIPAATLVIQDGDAAAQDFAISSEDLFIPGAEIEIAGGYSSDEAV